ncbi:hypothetical protein [Aeromonas caviae]|uniref:hypothetical protein n=1 Tax=Aeromonas caviae TaxID=648 RepID=UPI002B4A43C3|nr:hypothetical protein [Aeromonas caviae]
MDSFMFWRKNLDFSIHTGEVLDHKTHINHEVYSRGGTSYRPLEVKSKTITSKEVWLKMDDGSEAVFEFGARFPLRAGQKATFILAGTSDVDYECPVAVINHETGQHKIVLAPGEINSEFRLYGMTGKTIVFAFILFVSCFVLSANLGDHNKTGLFALPFIVPPLFLLYRWMTKGRRIFSLNDALVRHIENNIADIIKRHRESEGK